MDLNDEKDLKNSFDMEDTLELPVIEDNDMEITQPLPIVDEKVVSEEQTKKNLEALKKFLKMDMKSKEELMNLAPEELDDYDEVARMEYADKLDEGLDGFKFDFQQIAENFEFGPKVLESLDKFFQKAKNHLMIGKYENGIGNKVYREAFTNMRPKFIDEVKDECVGYTGSNPDRLAELIDKSETVNEALHVMHSYVMNNEKIMGSMPKLAEKQNKGKENITLYGEPSPVANEIFEKFPEELDVGITDIISMEDRVCMMIRDRGHALTIDMDTSEAEKVGVKYFIPKLCNEEMIRALKGIDKSSITPNGARGAFEAKTEEITSELFGFIEKVPTDGDMQRYNYEEMFEEMREEQKANEVNQQQEQIVEPKVQETKEEIIGSQKPIFSMDEAKEMAVGPNRIFSKIKDFQSKIASRLFNKEKEAPEMDKGDEISK